MGAKAEENYLAHALIKAIAKVDNDANYKAYRQGRKIRPVVQSLLKETCIDPTRGGGIGDLNRFKEHFRDYKIVVYQSLGCEDKMFEGQVDASKQVNLLYDDVERNYHLIINLTGAMAKSYVCKAGNKSCRSEITHVCDPSCSDCMTCPPCAFSDLRIPCEECNRHLRIRACFANHRVRQREIPYANVNFVAQLAECS